MFRYLKDVFSGSDSASFARYATAAHVLTGCGCLVYVVAKTHGFPDGGILTGLGAWTASPYVVNKVAAIFTPPAGPSPKDPHDLSTD